jgi:hypothetical protein
MMMYVKEESKTMKGYEGVQFWKGSFKEDLRGDIWIKSKEGSFR